VTKTALEKAREAPGSTKARILAAAEEVFAARGYQGASTREIAARAGVNISSLHYHWASKETLYAGVFADIFDRIVTILREIIGPLQERTPAGGGAVVDTAMTRLFDFFADNPSVPRLIMRRIVDDTELEVGLEEAVLVPAWEVFGEWVSLFGRRLTDVESRFFMLSVHSALLVYLLDSRFYQALLGGSVRKTPLRDEVRTHLVRLVHTLLEA
jgi:AcrR family transcriptional regulator